MKHNKEKSLCCGAPVSMLNRPLATEIAEKKMSEAEKVNADAMAFICTGCLSTLSRYATERNIKSYYITELAQMAIGETPSLKVPENTKKIQRHVVKTISENPNLLVDRYIIKNGKIIRL